MLTESVGSPLNCRILSISSFILLSLTVVLFAVVMLSPLHGRRTDVSLRFAAIELESMLTSAALSSPGSAVHDLAARLCLASRDPSFDIHHRRRLCHTGSDLVAAVCVSESSAKTP